MKRFISILLTVILIFLMTACQPSLNAELGQTQPNPPGSNGVSNPTSKEPPTLKILDSSSNGIEANKGTYSWTYDNGDGTQSGICADSSHPLEWQEFLIPMTTADDTVELNFDVQSQEFTVRCWSDAYWGQVDAKEESVTINGNKLELKEGGYIYEVVATWTGENLAAEGTVHYGLQNEFSLEENINLARQFLLEHFVSRGMTVDFAVHQPDTEDGGIKNPHLHVLCPSSVQNST